MTRQITDGDPADVPGHPTIDGLDWTGLDWTLFHAYDSRLALCSEPGKAGSGWRDMGSLDEDGRTCVCTWEACGEFNVGGVDAVAMRVNGILLSFFSFVFFFFLHLH